MDDYARALSDYNTYLALRPDAVNVFRVRGHAHRGLGDFESAFTDYNLFIIAHPKDAGAYYSRGLTYEEKGEFEKAIADYSAALDLKPDYGFALLHRGIAKLCLEDGDGHDDIREAAKYASEAVREALDEQTCLPILEMREKG